ncbi:MAG: AMP-binding protein, partial [Reyranellales bacterium]
MIKTVYDIVLAGDPHAPAIGAPGRPWLTYAGLKRLVDATIGSLNGVGVGREERIVLAVPNGPEMAAAFVAVASGFTAVPLDPAGTADQFEHCLADFKATVVIVQQGLDSPVRQVARKSGVPIVGLVPGVDRPAGAFTLDISALKPAEVEYASISDRTETALLRPGGISQSSGDLAQAARSIGATLRLAPADRCLNVLPLFDTDGLIGTLLPSLGAGASVCCSPGFDASSFFAWLAE